MQYRSLFTIILGLCLILHGPFVQSANVIPEHAPVVLVLGDSLSAGYGIDPAQGWVTLLQARLQNIRSAYQVINASISGETTIGGLTRLPALLDKHKPEIVVIELGANDGLRGLSLTAMQENLSRLIEHSRTVGSQVLLVGILLPPNYGPAYTKGFSSVYQNLAKRYSLPLVPFLLDGVATDNSLMQADGLHPNAAGQGRLLENVWPQLQTLLKSR